MKVRCFSKSMVVALGLAAALFAGCSKTPVGVTKIPGGGKMGNAGNSGNIGDSGRLTPIDDATSNSNLLNTTSIPLNPQDAHQGWAEDASALQGETVHFAFDSSVVRAEEKSKVSAVASQLKSQSSAAVRVDGHCDERGTEEYNRSLGERRAIALREELIRLGIDPTRVDTRSYGEDKPVDNGHSESAYSKNRRGEFILLTPPK